MRKKKPVKLNRPIPALRERQDVDYLHKLPRAAQKWLKKFLDELYGRNFKTQMLGKNSTTRKEIYHDTYAANNDMMHVLVRVDIDPTLVDLKIQTVPSSDRVTEKSNQPEVERVYIENGQKIIRYKAQKPR